MTISTRTLFLPALLSLALAGECATEAERFAAVKRYWEWSAYWAINGFDFPLARYRPGRSFRALVFFDAERDAGDPYWGFCSKDLGVCQAYQSWDDHVVDAARGTRIQRGESEQAALMRFQKQEFMSDEEAAYPGPQILVPLPPRPSAATGQSVPGAAIATVLDPMYNRPPREYLLQTITRVITLPKLALPEAVTHRISNRRLEQAILDDLGPPVLNPECTVTVPFADEHYPQVPVLYDCPPKRSITFVRKQLGAWTFTAGGYMPHPDIVRRFAPRILKNASLTVKR